MAPRAQWAVMKKTTTMTKVGVKVKETVASSIVSIHVSEMYVNDVIWNFVCTIENINSTLEG